MRKWLHGISLTSCYRAVRKQKWLVLAFVFSVYLSLFVVILSYQVVTHMPRRVSYAGSHYKVGSRINESVLLHHRKNRHLPPAKLISGSVFTPENFQFTRQDLRLQFKEIPPVPRDPFYDNKDTYFCEQGDLERHDTNVTEDLWCEPRPRYMSRYKNPCFEVKPNPLFPYGGVTCLPAFHILGADKCGTTDFHSRLTEHPRILLNGGGLGKETYYWCWLRYGLWMMKETKRTKWQRYLGFFYKPSIRIVTEVRRTGQQLITGDGTPMDLWDFRGWQKEPHNAGLDEPEVLTPHSMRHMYANPKFFVLMRNPVDRLYSDYIFLGYGFSPEKFARDVPVAIALMRDCLKVNSTRKCFFSDDMYHKSSMRMHIGCYSIFLREWLSVFRRENFFFVRTEDYHNNTSLTLEKAYKFLEVDELTPEELKLITSSKIKHQTIHKQRIGDMYPKTRALLTEFYAPFNEDLSRLLDDPRYLWKDVRETPVVAPGDARRSKLREAPPRHRRKG